MASVIIILLIAALLPNDKEVSAYIQEVNTANYKHDRLSTPHPIFS